MYKVNDNDKALFDQDGFLVVDRLIAADSLPPLHRAFDDLFHGRFETGVRPDEVNWQAATGDPDLSRQICNGWKANRRIARVVLDAGLAKNIAALGGWPGVRIMIDNVLWKPPATKSLGFHQDSGRLNIDFETRLPRLVHPVRTSDLLDRAGRYPGRWRHDRVRTRLA